MSDTPCASSRRLPAARCCWVLACSLSCVVSESASWRGCWLASPTTVCACPRAGGATSETAPAAVSLTSAACCWAVPATAPACWAAVSLTSEADDAAWSFTSPAADLASSVASVPELSPANGGPDGGGVVGYGVGRGG